MEIYGYSKGSKVEIWSKRSLIHKMACLAPLKGTGTPFAFNLLVRGSFFFFLLLCFDGLMA